MEIKGLPTLEWWLTKWLAAAGFPNVQVRVGGDFSYFPADNSIMVSLGVTEHHDLFLKFIQDTFKFPFTCDDFIISFFHELGHVNTWNCFDEEERKHYYADKMYLACFEEDWATLEYFRLLPEFYASEWAVNYIVQHQDTIEEFWRICKKILMNIYKINGVEIESE